MYVASKGGEAAIAAAHRLLAEERRGDRAAPALTLEQIAGQLALATARVMAEGSLYDPALAALAIKQSRGDLIEAVFLLRAYRTTLPRFGESLSLDTGAMRLERRISAAFKDAPGGQILGPTFDYSHRLLDFALAAEEDEAAAPPADPVCASGDDAATVPRAAPRILSFLDAEGLIEPAGPTAHERGSPDPEPGDLTREALELPADRALRLQALARADEGFLLGLAYSTQRGYARNHAFVGELRVGHATVSMEIPELGFAVDIGEARVTECETVNQFRGSKTEPTQFTRGYGLVFGHSERKALAMALIDRALRWRELGEEDQGHPVQDEEFVLSHADSVQSSGFLEHIKLPHHVDFQAELEMVRAMRREQRDGPGDGEDDRDGEQEAYE